ncbi:MAG: hypothetical protein ACFFD1_04595 [Candidatus Thorarchaeota archaeon]
MKEQTIVFWSVIVLFVSIILLIIGIRTLAIILFIASVISIYFAKDITKMTKKLKED